MGDRGFIELVYRNGRVAEPTDTTSIYLYTHWYGSEVHHILANALDSEEGRNRWGHGSYLARIIFDHLIATGDDPETGFGLSTWEPENEHAPLAPAVLLDEQRVLMNSRRYTYEDFITRFKDSDKDEPD